MIGSRLHASHVLKPALLIVALAWSVVGVAGAANLDDVRVQVIAVEPTIPYSASGEDDLSRIRGYFQGASWESPIPLATWHLLQAIGISRIRLINVEDQNCVQLDDSGSKLRFNFSSLQPGLQDSRTYGVTPHIIVGQGPQRALSIDGNGHSNGVSNWQYYEDYAYALLKYVVVDQRISNAEFEVANEPDVNGASWLLPGRYPLGDQKMYAAYIELYRAWAHAAKRISEQYPQAKLRIGGPDITSFSLGTGQFDWAGHFAKDVAAMKLQLDFFSFHFYGNLGALAELPAFGPYPTFDGQVDRFRNALTSAGLYNVPLYLTEWGPSYVVDESPAGRINGNNVGAAWTARFLIDMNAKGVEEALALTLRDHLDSKQVNNWGWPSFLLADGLTRKALYNLACIFSKMPGRRVKASQLDGSVGVVASADDKEIGILVFNQDWDYVQSKERAVKQNIRIRIQSLPFPAAQVHIVRYVVDSTHGNAFSFHQRGLPIDRERVGLSPTNEMTLPASSNGVSLENVALPPSSLSFWIVKATEH